MKTKLLAFAIPFTVITACASPEDTDDIESDDKVMRFPGSDVEVALHEDGSYTITFDERRQIERTPTFELMHQRGSFDPRGGAPALIPGLDDRTAPGADVPQLYIVQFMTQPIEEYRTRLRVLGATSHQYFPRHAHIVRMTSAAAAAVRAEPFVRWVGEYRPSWRLETALSDKFAARAALPTQRYWIQALTTDLADKQDLGQRLAALGATVDTVNRGGYLVGATLSKSQLAAITAWSDVVYVDRWSAPEADMDIVRQIDGANYVETMGGYKGQGLRAEVMDGNVLDTHVDFASRPLVFHGARGTDKFHGTATTGIVFGDGTGNAMGRGMLPMAQGIFASYETVTDRPAHTAQLLQEPYKALFQSNSWGDARTTLYTNISADMDQMLFDNDILILQSQSNAGNQDSRPQAWAKNILSVGGINHFNTLVTTDDHWQNSGSIGPAADGRIKPDLSHFYDLTFAPDYGGGYANFGGTSGATPITAGHAGLFFQMWGDGLFGPTRPGPTAFDRRPHSTTAKAMMINSASAYPFSGQAHDLTRTHQGWGRPNVKRLYDLRGRFFIVDESDVLATGARTSHRVEVAAGMPELRATLTWKDPAGVPGAALARINDLTLRVVSPSGTIYFGNNGLRDGNTSTAGGAANTIDTVENVWVQNPEAGIWTVEVSADELNADGHPGTPAVDADYALVVSDVTAVEEPPPPSVRFAQVAYDMPGNDTLEEWVELYNPGTATVDVSGWKIRDDFRTFTLPAGTTIGPKAYLDVARNAAAYTALTGETPNVAGLSCSLGNTGDHLTLLDPSGASMDFVAWEDGFPGWDTLATKRGRVIVRKSSDIDTDVRADWTVRDPNPRGGDLSYNARMSVRTSLPEKKLHKALDRVQRAQSRVLDRYPGDSGARQPVHTVYGGAHLFTAETAKKLGELALRSLETYAPDAATFAEAIGVRGELAPKVYERVREKLRREAVEDFRIDFEDGYGNRPDAEEDGHAAAAAHQVAAGYVAGTLPPFIGIRIKPLTRELAARSLRTLDVFLTELLDKTNGHLPPNFVTTLPKILSKADVETLVDVLEILEDRLGLEAGELKIEFMVETTQSIFDAQGRSILPRLHRAADGRLTGAHFGTYDYTANCDITAAHQRMRHPACDFAKHMMKVAFAGTGVMLSDGATNIMPVAPHKGASLTDQQKAENRAAVFAAWRLHADDLRHSLINGFYQGWDLHPAQLPTRYGAVYAFFLDGLAAASDRLRNFVDKAAQATLVGDVFDDAATGQGLLNYFLRGIACGAVTEQEALATGLSLDEIRSKSFVKIMNARRAQP